MLSKKNIIIIIKNNSILSTSSTNSSHPGLELELQQLDSGSQAEQEPLFLWFLAGLVQLAGLALVEAASLAALAVDIVDIARRAAASAEVAVADKEAVVELRDWWGEQSEQEQRELKKMNKKHGEISDHTVQNKLKSFLLILYHLYLIWQQ